MAAVADRRILIFTSEFPPQPGGIGNHAWNLACELCRRGADVRLITEGRQGGGEEEATFDAAAPFKILRIRFTVVGVRQMRRVSLYLRQLTLWKPDIVVASGRFPLLLVPRIPSAAVTIAILHGTEAGAPESAARKLSMAAVQRFRVLIPVSRFTRAYFALDSNDPRVSVIPNGVPQDRFAGLPVDASQTFAGSPRLVTVGNVTRRKGQDNVIRALPALLRRYPDAVYHIAGIPTEREAFAELARRLGVEKNVVFHGAVSDSVLCDLLKGADVFLMLSTAAESGDVEGFGIAILEANLLGVPAVGSKGCGIEDAIYHRWSGMLVDPMDVNAVVDAIATVMRERETFSRKAIEWVAGHSWQAVGDLYEQALGATLPEVR